MFSHKNYVEIHLWCFKLSIICCFAMALVRNGPDVNGMFAQWYYRLAPIQMWTCKVLKLPMFLKPDHSSPLDLLTIKNFNPHILISSGLFALVYFHSNL